MANLAQLVEPRFVVPVVVGSSPIVRPRLKKAPFKRCFFCANSGFLQKTALSEDNAVKI